jgi:hypothetical protein
MADFVTVADMVAVLVENADRDALADFVAVREPVDVCVGIAAIAAM